MISVSKELPKVNGRVSKPVSFVVDGEVFIGVYHENGWFYSSDRLAGKMHKKAIMAKGPKAECRMQSWGELPQAEVTEWEYVGSNAELKGG